MRGFRDHPVPPPLSLDALVIDPPARITQHSRDTAIAMAAILAGQFDHARKQPLLVRTTHGRSALYRAVLAQHREGSALRDAQLIACPVDAGTMTGGV